MGGAPDHARFPALPVEGRADSRVRVITYEDLQCPDCAEWRRALDRRFLPRFGSSVAFAAKDFPPEKHRWAELAAMASRRFASWNSSAGIEFRRFCLERIADINVENLPERVAEFAAARDMNSADAVLALENEELRDAVRADKAEGERRGVVKTPTLFVGTISFVERFDVENVAIALETALRREGSSRRV